MIDFFDFGFTNEVSLDKPSVKYDDLQGLKDIIWPFLENFKKTNPKRVKVINDLQQKIEEYIKEKNELKR